MSIIYSDRRGNARSSGQTTSNFLTQASWRLYEIRPPPTCMCTTSNFLTNTTIETFHFGRHRATTPRDKYHKQVRQDRDDRQGRGDRQDKQAKYDWHLNLTFQDTCLGQLSQFLWFFVCFVLLERSKSPKKMKKFVIMVKSKEGLTYQIIMKPILRK